MSNNIALIVAKECNICKHVNIPEYSEQLMCNLTLEQVNDAHLCDSFEICSEIFNDCFFNIKEVKNVTQD